MNLFPKFMPREPMSSRKRWPQAIAMPFRFVGEWRRAHAKEYAPPPPLTPRIFLHHVRGSAIRVK